MSDNNNNKKKKFNLYDFLNRNQNEVDAESEIGVPRNLKYFFKLLKRKLSYLFQVNLLMVFGNFPIIFILLALTGNFSAETTAPQSILFAPVYGAMQFENNPAIMSLFGVVGNQTAIIVNTTTTYVLYALGLLIIFTFGLVNAGTAYILRNIVRGEPIFLMHDFFSTIKKNLRQALTIGIIDSVLIALSFYNIVFYAYNSQNTLTGMFFYLNIGFVFIYLLMRMYMYVLLVTFNLKITKIFKNSLIFAILGIKRNILAFLGIVLVLFLNYLMIGIFAPIGIILPLIITLSLMWFICIYAAYPKIKEIMIDPYYYEDGTPKESAETQE